MEINEIEYEILIELADNGDTQAMLELVSDFHFNKKNGMNDRSKIIENKKIFEYINILIENGDCDSMHLLGSFYYNGNTEFVEKNYEKAVYWYNEALKNKPLSKNKKYQIDMYNTLGYCYYYGYVDKPDYKKAFLHYAKAALLGHPNAMYKIGDMYREGFYIVKDLEKAFYWYNKAYRKRYTTNNDFFITASTSLRLGRAYLKGEGIEKELLKALKYLQIAEKYFYFLIINKPPLSAFEFANKPLEKTKELLIIVRDELNKLVENNKGDI